MYLHSQSTTQPTTQLITYTRTHSPCPPPTCPPSSLGSDIHVRIPVGLMKPSLWASAGAFQRPPPSAPPTRNPAGMAGGDGGGAVTSMHSSPGHKDHPPGGGVGVLGRREALTCRPRVRILRTKGNGRQGDRNLPGEGGWRREKERD